MSLDALLCTDHCGYGPALVVMVVSGVWSLSSPRGRGGWCGGRARLPVTSLQSPLSPPSLTTITISHHRTPGPGGRQDRTRTSDQHQQGNNSVINYTQPGQHLRHASSMSRITGQGLMTHHHQTNYVLFPFFNVHFMGEQDDI